VTGAGGRLRARAVFLGPRIDERPLGRSETTALAPRTLRAGRDGHAVVFRFGAVVLLGLAPDEEQAFLASLAPLVADPYARPESDEVEIEIDAARRERLEPDGVLVLREASVARLQVVATVLAKSTVLAYYEALVATVFDRVERLAAEFRRGARPVRSRELLREIGSVLLIQTATVGRVEVTEKPEITWDDPELDRLYERLARAYDLGDRDRALARKLEVIASTATTYLDLLQDRQTIRVEWYIVILIVFEIALLLWEMARPR
jgi:uncharacterized Rmd1/YagE family protein